MPQGNQVPQKHCTSRLKVDRLICSQEHDVVFWKAGIANESVSNSSSIVDRPDIRIYLGIVVGIYSDYQSPTHIGLGEIRNLGRLGTDEERIDTKARDQDRKRVVCGKRVYLGG